MSGSTSICMESDRQRHGQSAPRRDSARRSRRANSLFSRIQFPVRANSFPVRSNRIPCSPVLPCGSRELAAAGPAFVHRATAPARRRLPFAHRRARRGRKTACGYCFTKIENRDRLFWLSKDAHHRFARNHVDRRDKPGDDVHSAWPRIASVGLSRRASGDARCSRDPLPPCHPRKRGDPGSRADKYPDPAPGSFPQPSCALPPWMPACAGMTTLRVTLLAACRR